MNWIYSRADLSINSYLLMGGYIWGLTLSEMCVICSMDLWACIDVNETNPFRCAGSGEYLLYLCPAC